MTAFVTRSLVAAALALAAPVLLAQASAPAAPLPSSPAKKELVQKILQLQQAEIEAVARNIVERPAGAMLQQAAMAMQMVPAEKREAAGKTIETEARKYVDETYPLVRERAVRTAPGTVGATLEEKLTEDELRTLHGWLTSPLNRKYQSIVPELRDAFVKKLLAETAPIVEPRAQALDAKIRTALGAPPVSGGGGGGPAAARPASRAATPSRPASATR